MRKKTFKLSAAQMVPLIRGMGGCPDEFEQRSARELFREWLSPFPGGL